MILLIGLDGYSWSWEGALRERGFDVAPLLSPHPVSWLGWNTIGTGVEASTWGLTADPKTYAAFGRSGKERPPYLWERLDDAGERVVIVNWPFVINPHLSNGVLVCGYPAGRIGFVQPLRERDRWTYEDLDLSNAFELATVGPAVRQRLLRMAPQEHITACTQRRGRLEESFIAAVKRQKPTLAFLGIMDLDRLCHYAYSSMQSDTERATIIAGVLDSVEHVVEALEPEATILCSDHGLDCSAPAQADGRGQGHDLGLPDSLRGILALKQDGLSLPSAEAAQIDVASMVQNRISEFGGVDMAAESPK